MAREQDWWTASHPADVALPGLRIRWESYQEWESRLDQSLRALESQWEGWVTARSATASSRIKRNAPPQVGAHETP